MTPAHPYRAEYLHGQGYAIVTGPGLDEPILLPTEHIANVVKFALDCAYIAGREAELIESRKACLAAVDRAIAAITGDAT